MTVPSVENSITLLHPLGGVAGGWVKFVTLFGRGGRGWGNDTYMRFRGTKEQHTFLILSGLCLPPRLLVWAPFCY